MCHEYGCNLYILEQRRQQYAQICHQDLVQAPLALFLLEVYLVLLLHQTGQTATGLPTVCPLDLPLHLVLALALCREGQITSMAPQDHIFQTFTVLPRALCPPLLLASPQSTVIVWGRRRVRPHSEVPLGGSHLQGVVVCLLDRQDLIILPDKGLLSAKDVRCLVIRMALR